MSRQVLFDPAAEKQFSKLGKPAQSAIVKYIGKNLEQDQDPRRFGKPFLSIQGAWRYWSATTGLSAGYKLTSSSSWW